MFDLKQLNVTVLGAQRSGLAAAKLAHVQGGSVRISDLGSLDQVPKESRDWIMDHSIRTEFGEHTEDFVCDSDLVILSPGVPVHSKAVSWVRDKGILFLGEIEFAAQFATKPIIAVTGSNGKTTVVSLIDRMLNASGVKSCLCGNVGMPFSEHVVKDSGVDCYTLEVSSFQMESLLGSEFGASARDDVKRFRPNVAVLLNVSENHLDRHADMDEYIRAKSNIFLNQKADDCAVINGIDETCRKISGTFTSKVFTFSDGGQWQNPNIEAAAVAAKLMGANDAAIKKAIKEFGGVEHRLEKVATIEGVEFVNDSKSTTPRASLWAIERMDRPVIWICGGRDKNLNFDIGQEFVRGKVKDIIAIGEAKEKIAHTFENTVQVTSADSFEEGFELAVRKAVSGDCILLSPMCASFDMFRNFEERGEEFKRLVSEYEGRTAGA